MVTSLAAYSGLRATESWRRVGVTWRGVIDGVALYGMSTLDRRASPCLQADHKWPNAATQRLGWSWRICRLAGWNGEISNRHTAPKCVTRYCPFFALGPRQIAVGHSGHRSRLFVCRQRR